MNKKMSVPVIGTGLENLKPDVSKLTDLLLEKGFRPLTKESSQELPIGSLVLIHDGKNPRLYFYLVQKHVFWNNEYLGFNHSFKLQTPASIQATKTFCDFNQQFFKVIAQVNVIDGIPQANELPDVLKGIGFKPLAEATPEDISTGNLVFLYEKNGSITPIIIRVLSHQFADDHRLLFWKQGYIVAGNWEEAVIMEHLTPFEKYEYFVF